MKVIKNNEELKSYIKDGEIVFNDSIKCDFNIDVEASIKARNIKAYNIKAWHIKAGDIKAEDIKAGDIKARNINAWDIKATRINAENISFYAFCISYKDIKCLSIKGLRNNNFYKCLDGKLIIKNNELKELEEKYKELGEKIKQFKNK